MNEREIKLLRYLRAECAAEMAQRECADLNTEPSRERLAVIEKCLAMVPVVAAARGVTKEPAGCGEFLNYYEGLKNALAKLDEVAK